MSLGTHENTFFWQYEEFVVCFTVPAGATDVALLYNVPRDYYYFDDFTLTAQTITGGHNPTIGTYDGKKQYHITANVSSWSNFRPKMTVGVANGYQHDNQSYSHKELYYVAAEVMVSEGTQLQFIVKHYDKSGVLSLQ